VPGQAEAVYRPCLVGGPREDPSYGQRVLVVPIGQSFLEGVAEGVIAAAGGYKEAMKAPCDIFVLQSLTVLPPLGLGEMRNLAIMKAYLEGYSHLMIIDNDVVMEPDTVARLVNRGRGFVVPWFEQIYREGQSPELIHWPMFQPGQGLRRLNWTVPYCILYDIELFRSGCVDVRCHTPSMVYNEDEINSVYLRCHGVDLWQDTDTKVKLLRGPRMLHESLKELKIAKPFEMPK
jgi:hypothetical protein